MKTAVLGKGKQPPFCVSVRPDSGLISDLARLLNERERLISFWNCLIESWTTVERAVRYSTQTHWLQLRAVRPGPGRTKR